MGKPEWIKHRLHLDRFQSPSATKATVTCMDEGRIIFDRYDLPASLKRLTRQYDKATTSQYHITDTTNIANVQMRTLMVHVNTKMQLTEYFAKRMLEMALAAEHPVVVAWGSECTATYTD